MKELRYKCALCGTRSSKCSNCPANRLYSIVVPELADLKALKALPVEEDEMALIVQYFTVDQHKLVSEKKIGGSAPYLASKMEVRHCFAGTFPEPEERLYQQLTSIASRLKQAGFEYFLN